MKFYSMKLKKSIEIKDNMIRKVVKKGRLFAVGKYKVNGKEYEAWRILGLAKKK